MESTQKVRLYWVFLISIFRRYANSVGDKGANGVKSKETFLEEMDSYTHVQVFEGSKKQ